MIIQPRILPISMLNANSDPEPTYDDTMDPCSPNFDINSWL